MQTLNDVLKAISSMLVILLVEAEAVLGFEVEGVFLLVFGHGVTFNRSIICLIPLA